MLSSATRQLDLRRNQIETITNELSSYTDLEMLDLSENRIVLLQTQVFLNLTNLRLLRLDKNKITDLHKDLFVGLQQLTVLNLNDNNIAYIPSGTFADLSKLELLDLSRNTITASLMSPRTFSGLSNMQTLILSNNRLRTLPSSSLKFLDNLKMLDLSYNVIETIQSNGFFGLSSLNELHLHDNEIDFVTKWAFQGLNWLRKLTLYNNRLKSIPTDPLSELHHLQFLDVSGNLYDTITEDSFMAMPWLQHLRLNHCPMLKTISNNSFSHGLDSLQTLELNSNFRLNHIEKAALRELTNLKNLYLHDNMLINLDEDLLDWRELELIDLTHNPWRCDCSLKWFPRMLKEARNSTRQLLSMVKCGSPNRMFQKYVHDTIPSEYVCKYHRTDKRIIVASSAAGACICVLVIIVFVYRSRHVICDKVKRRFRYRVFENSQVAGQEEEMRHTGWTWRLTLLISVVTRLWRVCRVVVCSMIFL